jgi:putative DNA primase/helicase
MLAFLYGAGRNGKSVAVETLAELLGDYHSATRSESLSITRGGGIPNDIAALAGARLVTVSETPEGARLNESLVKDLTGGDLMSARFLRHEFFKFRPKFKLWIRGNHKPQIRGTDDGIWRRICLIPFTVQIPEQEVDPKLAEKLITELPGILNWAVKGCLAWQEQGLNAPDLIKNAVREYRSEMDILGEFFSECCVVDPSLSCSAKELHREYKRWCEDYGHKVIEQHRFGRALRERGFEKTKPKTVIWHGIGLVSDHSDLSALSRSSSYTRAHNAGDAEKRAQSSERSEYCPQCDGEGCTWCSCAEGVAA